MRGPWDQPVRFCWKTFFQPSEQLSDSCLNCLAFPPVTLAALQFQQFQGWTLAIPTLSYQDTSANTSVISSSSSSDMSSSSPCLHQQNEGFCRFERFHFPLKSHSVPQLKSIKSIKSRAHRRKISSVTKCWVPSK